MILLHYPSWTSSRKAKVWLEENNIEFEIRHTVKQTPSKEEFLMWQKNSGVDKKKFVNTNGKRFKEMELKDKIDDMSKEELFELISADGMLVKRPIIIGEDFVISGFKLKELEDMKENLGL